MTTKLPSRLLAALLYGQVLFGVAAVAIVAMKAPAPEYRASGAKITIVAESPVAATIR
jgi:hypothetical protein